MTIRDHLPGQTRRPGRSHRGRPLPKWELDDRPTTSTCDGSCLVVLLAASLATQKGAGSLVPGRRVGDLDPLVARQLADGEPLQVVHDTQSRPNTNLRIAAVRVPGGRGAGPSTRLSYGRQVETADLLLREPARKAVGGVVALHGAGLPQRDQPLFSHLARILGPLGYAVLSYDRRATDA